MAQFDSLLEEVRAARNMPTPERALEIRVHARVTQERMAAELGVSRATLSRWERGVVSPSSEHSTRYAELLAALAREVAA